MVSKRPAARFELTYWPLPFRGCFVSYLFAYRDVPLRETAEMERILEMMEAEPREQAVPFVGPPVLRDLSSGRCISQMPAIVLYVADPLDLKPEDPFALAMCLKILMDCNDLLMEICRYNGSSMWKRDDWIEFRAQRFPRWLSVFEESLQRGAIGGTTPSFADIGTYALFGNMIRCLPELETDLLGHAPGIHALCQKIGGQASLARYVQEQERRYGELYCGGYIEQSIRSMLRLDRSGSDHPRGQ